MQLLIGAFGLILLAIPSLVLSQAGSRCYTPSVTPQPGYCVPSHQCQFVRELRATYGNNIPWHIKNQLKQMLCNPSQRTVLHLCCPSASVITPQSDGSANRDTFSSPKTNAGGSTTTVSKTTDPRGMQVLESMSDKCGKKANSKLSGGEITSLGEFPWLVLLKYKVSSGRPFLCGGSLISDRFVLTAAHCMAAENPIGVRMGDYDLDKEEDCKFLGGKRICLPPYEEFGIEDIRTHPNYKGIMNDIALIKLDRPVKFKWHIKPICLPIDEKSKEIAYNQDFYISGWGRTEKNVASSVLLKGVVTRTDLNVCRDFYVGRPVLNNHICAVGERILHTCRGDSGGPLFIRNYFKDDSRYVQYGIVSYGGNLCGQRVDQPGVFSSVLDLMPWITQNLY